jgi:hypothetical protein
MMHRLSPARAFLKEAKRCSSPARTILAAPIKRRRYGLAKKERSKRINFEILGSGNFISA